MKTNGLRNLSFQLITLITIIFMSCDDDGQKPSTDPAAKEKAAKVMTLREDLNFINRFIDTNVIDPGSEEGRVSIVNQTVARIKENTPCAEATEEELPDGSVKVSLDFGEGCETEDGVVVSGAVIITFHVTENSFTFALEFINYSELTGAYEGEVVTGTVDGSFNFDLEASTFVQAMEQDLTIVYSDGTEASYKIAQQAEMTETGMRVTVLTTSGNLSDGGQFSTTLSKALIYDFACEGDFPVRGEELLNFQGNTILVNYGNGSCDDQYTVK
jgi:hypothetical protein